MAPNPADSPPQALRTWPVGSAPGASSPSDWSLASPTDPASQVVTLPSIERLGSLADDALIEVQRQAGAARRRVDAVNAAIAGEIARRSDRVARTSGFGRPPRRRNTGGRDSESHWGFCDRRKSPHRCRCRDRHRSPRGLHRSHLPSRTVPCRWPPLPRSPADSVPPRRRSPPMTCWMPPPNLWTSHASPPRKALPAPPASYGRGWMSRPLPTWKRTAGHAGR